MGVKYLWDTNTVIYYLQNQFPPDAQRFMDEVLLNFHPAISAISEIELLCWKTPTKEEQSILINFIGDSIIFELEHDVKYKTAELRRQKKFKLPDAIIAATALVHNLTLLTRNVPDFGDIPGLKIENPWDKIIT